jgi:hypothetical protein
MQTSRSDGRCQSALGLISLMAALASGGCSDRGGGAIGPADAARSEAGVTRVPIEAAPVDVAAVALACQQYGSAFCAKLEACAPRTFARDHASLAACQSSTERTCRESLTLPGQMMTLASLSSCIRGVEMFTCQARPSLPPACPAGRGNLAEGNPCRQTSQCRRTHYCRIPTGMECGLCHPPLPAGAECTSSDLCEPGSRCVLPGNGPIGQCLGSMKLRGQGCSPFDQCEPGTLCTAGTCTEPTREPAPPPTAPPPPANLGEDCSRVSCDSRQDGLYCNRLTSICEPMLPLAMPGQPCGTLVDGSGGIVYCTPGTSCVGRQGLTRTCEADLPTGAACQPTLGPRCARPATCVSGTCQERDPICA